MHRKRPLTEVQSHVLDNLARVNERPYKLAVKNPLVRYELDGADCSPQITALVVRKLVEVAGNGQLVRVLASEARL